jgi:hypothetical protein
MGPAIRFAGDGEAMHFGWRDMVVQAAPAYAKHMRCRVARRTFVALIAAVVFVGRKARATPPFSPLTIDLAVRDWRPFFASHAASEFSGYL